LDNPFNGVEKPGLSQTKVESGNPYLSCEKRRKILIRLINARSVVYSIHFHGHRVQMIDTGGCSLVFPEEKDTILTADNLGG
jgi:hypothetical protein